MARKPKNKNQKQYGNKFNKDLKKNLWKKKLRYTQNIILHIKNLCFTVCNFYKIFKKRKAKHTLFLFTGSLYFD